MEAGEREKEMGMEMGTIDIGTLNLVTTMGMGTVAYEIANQHTEKAILSFLTQLDEQVASWDFTQKAARLFADKALGEYEGRKSPDVAALRNLTEFIRQLRANPSVERDPNFYTVWTDPRAKPVHLSVHDLEALVNLATLSLKRS